MAKVRSWEVSDEFWKRVEPLIQKREREYNKAFHRKPGDGRKPMPERRVFEAIVFVLRTECNGSRCPGNGLGVRTPYTSTSANSSRQASFSPFGVPVSSGNGVPSRPDTSGL